MVKDRGERSRLDPNHHEQGGLTVMARRSLSPSRVAQKLREHHHAVITLALHRASELRALRPRQGNSPYVFVTEAGAPVTTAWFLRMVQRTGHAAKLPFTVHPHMLRHSTGYKLANDGHDTRSLAHYLWHPQSAIDRAIHCAGAGLCAVVAGLERCSENVRALRGSPSATIHNYRAQTTSRPIARHNMSGDYDGPNLGGVGDGDRDRGRALADEDRLRFYYDLDIDDNCFGQSSLWVIRDVAPQRKSTSLCSCGC